MVHQNTCHFVDYSSLRYGHNQHNNIQSNPKIPEQPEQKEYDENSDDDPITKPAIAEGPEACEPEKECDIGVPIRPSLYIFLIFSPFFNKYN